MDRALAIRAASLYVPVLATWALIVHRRPDRRLAAATFLASAWALPALDLVAVRLRWWSFDATGGMFLGFPVDLWIGWTLLWGAIPILAAPRAPLWTVIAALAWLDLLVMPASAPVVRLGGGWLTGEVVALTACLLPAQLLGRWTLHDEHLRARALMQVVVFGALSLWLLPAVVMAPTGGSWATLAHRPAWLLQVGAQALALPGAMAAAAVLEFAERGGGTPFPWDPPRRLVTSGPYAYVANPMQLGMTLILMLLGVLLWSWAVVVAGLVAGIFGAGFAAWQEGGDLLAAHGDGWRRYRAVQRDWLPHWRPRYPEGEAAATLYVAASCVECSQVGMWFARRRPVGMDLAPAERFPGSAVPRRITYVGPDGATYRGVGALARAADHLTLGWAVAGWLARLPVVCQALQVLVDAAGGGERGIERDAKPVGAFR